MQVTVPMAVQYIRVVAMWLLGVVLVGHLRRRLLRESAEEYLEKFGIEHPEYQGLSTQRRLQEPRSKWLSKSGFLAYQPNVLSEVVNTVANVALLAGLYWGVWNVSSSSSTVSPNDPDQPPAVETPCEPAEPNRRSVASDGSDFASLVSTPVRQLIDDMNDCCANTCPWDQIQNEISGTTLKPGRRPHNWRSHIPDLMKDHWGDFSLECRLVAFAIAADLAFRADSDWEQDSDCR